MVRIPSIFRSRVAVVALCLASVGVLVGSGLSVLLPRIAGAQSAGTPLSTLESVGVLGGRANCFYAPVVVYPVARCPKLSIQATNVTNGVSGTGFQANLGSGFNWLDNSMVVVVKMASGGANLQLAVNCYDGGGCTGANNAPASWVGLAADNGVIRGSAWHTQWPVDHTDSGGTIPMDSYSVVQITQEQNITKYFVNGHQTYDLATWGAHPLGWGLHHSTMGFSGDNNGLNASTMIYEAPVTGLAPISPAEAAALLIATQAVLPPTVGPSSSTTTTTALPVPASALNPDGRAPCYYVPGMTLPVARCTGIYTYGFQNGPVAGAGLGVPGSIAGNSYLAVIRLPESGSSSDNHLVAQLGGCANGQSGQLLAVKNFGGQIQTTRIDCINGYFSYHAVNSVLGFGSSTEYKVLQVTLPQGSGVSNKIYVDGVDMGISYESIPGLAFDCCYPGPYGETALSLAPGPANFGQNINSIKYVSVLQGTAPLSPTQAAALLAAVMPPSTTTTTTTAVVSSTTTTSPGPLSGVLTASIVRGTNNAAGASVYTVTLKVTGATSGALYEFVVPSGHVPDPVTHRYPKTAVAGEVVWEYSLVAPRGVFRAEVYSAGGLTPISTVEVK
jgi:hypothetical protein